MGDPIPPPGPRFERDTSLWSPDKLEEWVLEARGHRWAVTAYSVMVSDGCCWAQLLLRGHRCYELLLKIAPLLAPHDILSALEAWLTGGGEPAKGVQIVSSHEVAGARGVWRKLSLVPTDS